MPATGGTYVYLREAFGKTRLGGLLPFLFIWQFIFSGPLEIASGYIGFAQYVGYFWPGMGTGATRAVSMSVGLLVIASALSARHQHREVDGGAVDRHVDHRAVGNRRRTDPFQHQSRIRFSAERVPFFDWFCRRAWARPR